MRSSRAERRFKQLAGNVNHFLITIMIGLDAVGDGTAKLSPTFATSWAPHDVRRSAQRSREFALKALIAWLVDALDAYVRELNKKPFLIQDDDARMEMDSLGRSVYARVSWLGEHFGMSESVPFALSVLAVTWRNRLVHSDADNALPKEVRQILEVEADTISEEFQGLDVARTMTNLNAAAVPSLKEATALVRAAHLLVREADEKLREDLDIEVLLEEGLQRYIGEDSLQRAARIWGKGKEKALKSLRQVALNIGLTEEDGARALGDEVMSELASLSEVQARQRFG